MEYEEVCRYIWKNLVPKQGQADNLHGEMLRQVEALRWEIQENGCINWDESFDYFCDFLSTEFVGLGHMDFNYVLTHDERSKAHALIIGIQNMGRINVKWQAGGMSDKKFEKKIATLATFIEDEPYDFLCDLIGKFYKFHDNIIPYEKNPKVYR